MISKYGKIFKISYVTSCSEWRITEYFDLPYYEINKVKAISRYGYEVFVNLSCYSTAFVRGQRLIENYIESKNSSDCSIDLEDKIFEVGYQLNDKKWMVEEIPDIPARHYSSQAYITYWGYQTYVHADSYITAMESGTKIINNEIEARKRVDRGLMKYAVIRVEENVVNPSCNISVAFIAYSQAEALKFVRSRDDSVAIYLICTVPTEEEQVSLCNQ